MKTLLKEQALSRFRFPPPGKALLVLYFALLLLAIFYIPYWFPVAPTGSDSYIFGYNNTVGELLVVLLFSFAALWTRGLNLDFSSNEKSPAIPSKVLWISLGIELAACVAVYLRVGRYGAFGDSQYEIHRIWLISLGKVPYRDFEWIYGSGLLYVPAWFSRWFHLSIPDAYYLFWTIASLAGVALLFATINLIDFPCSRKTTIFVLYCLPAITATVYMGLSSTLLRAFFPLCCLLLTYNVRIRGAGQETNAKVAALAVLFIAAIILISPEMSIAFAFACAVVFCPANFARLQGLPLIPYLLTLLALSGFLFCGVQFHAFDGVRAAGRGSISFPITFAPATLIFFAVIFLCACYVVRRMLQPSIRDNTIVLIILGLPMMASALGRCDAGHILGSGAPFFICAGFYASKVQRFWRLYRSAVSVCVFITVFYTIMIMISVLITGRHLPAFSGKADLYSLFSGEETDRSGEMLEAPFGFLPRATSFYYSPQIDYGYYDGMVDVMTEEAFRRKISELARKPERDLLLPSDVWGGCDLVDVRVRRRVIGYLLLSPYTAQAMHTESVTKPLCDYVRSHYTVIVSATPKSFNYELWSPKGKEPVQSP